MLVLLQLAFQLQRAFLRQRFLQTLILRRTIGGVRPIGEVILGQFQSVIFGQIF